MQESQHIELKRHWKDDYLKWVCAFANSNGGTLMIGYNDQGEAVGVSNVDRLLEEIPNKVRDVLGIMVEVNLVTHQQLSTLYIITEPYPYPVSYKGEYHYRSGSTKQELKGAALDKFLMRKYGITWDSVPVPYVKISDLDSKAITHFCRQAIRKQRLPEEILESWYQLRRALPQGALSLTHPRAERSLAKCSGTQGLQR